MANPSLMQLYDGSGCRKYLTDDERDRFRMAAFEQPDREAAFCLLLHYTGCRLSEALALTRSQIDREQGLIVLRSLKKRQARSFRPVPVPSELIEWLLALPSDLPDGLLWSFSRTTAWRKIKEVLTVASICGVHACPRGLRHGYGVSNTLSGVPVTQLKEWMGHANLETTAIYLAVTGPEERQLAERNWKHDVWPQTMKALADYEHL